MRVLIIAAHPDDELLGAGGTWHRYKRYRDSVSAMIISNGRDDPIDQRFDTLPIKDFISKIEDVVKTFKPDIVFTHWKDDVNKDHQITYEATRIACRPTKSSVKALYAFDSTMSAFNTIDPTYFVTLSEQDVFWKISQMKLLYSKEMNVPIRQGSGIISQARFWGNKIGVEYAEPFVTVFDIDG